MLGEVVAVPLLDDLKSFNRSDFPNFTEECIQAPVGKDNKISLNLPTTQLSVNREIKRKELYVVI